MVEESNIGTLWTHKVSFSALPCLFVTFVSVIIQLQRIESTLPIITRRDLLNVIKCNIGSLEGLKNQP